jgi:hypothetical protein
LTDLESIASRTPNVEEEVEKMKEIDFLTVSGTGSECSFNSKLVCGVYDEQALLVQLSGRKRKRSIRGSQFSRSERHFDHEDTIKENLAGVVGSVVDADAFIEQCAPSQNTENSFEENIQQYLNKSNKSEKDRYTFIKSCLKDYKLVMSDKPRLEQFLGTVVNTIELSIFEVEVIIFLNISFYFNLSIIRFERNAPT